MIEHEKNELTTTPLYDLMFGEQSEYARKLAEHRAWMQSIVHERPPAGTPFKVGVYIRFFNQTKYENYLEHHKKQFLDTIAMCPKWALVDFYVDTGAVAPNMESASEWCRLLEDCMAGKVDLILTQKVSNVTRKPNEVTLLSRIMATQEPPIGIYFISEDIYTLASYYQHDIRDTYFFSDDWNFEVAGEMERGLLND